MAKLTQSDVILNMLRAEPERWFASHECMMKQTKWGWIGSAGSRRSREMAEVGEIEVRHGKYAEYRALKPKKVEWFVVPTTGEKFSKITW